MKLVTVEEMKQLEQRADASGQSYAAMMENAGRAVADAIKQRVPVKNKRILALIGPGNNGGDGLVAARHLSQDGAQIICYLWQPRPEDDPNLKAVRERNIHCLRADGEGDGKTLHKALQNADVIIDALLGTGIARPIEGGLKELLDTVRQVVANRRGPQPSNLRRLVPGPHSVAGAETAAPFMVAVDVPSGLNCDTGEVDAATVPADLTVTFSAAKHGQFRFPGAEAIGELIIADIGIDPALAQDIRTHVATPHLIGALLPERPLDAHKGTFGKAIIVAGSVHYVGAPYLAAAAAARVGTGLVTLAPPQPLYSILAGKLSEATFLLLPHDMGVFVPAATKVLAPRLAEYAALLVGPGLGREDETIAFVHQLLGIARGGRSRHIGFRHETDLSAEKVSLPPIVVDADALNALAEVENWWVAGAAS